MQIYCDFSGYSDIAIGTARLFGFSIMRNFAYPYFARDISEFWHRWHISLSTWFRDYVYIPLGGSRVGKVRTACNLIFTFAVSGLWHGANWTFVVWGLLHGLYYVPARLLKKQQRAVDIVAQGRMLPTIADVGRMLATFMVVMMAWVFFRATSVGQAVHFIGRIVTVPYLGLGYGQYLEPLTYAMVPLVVEWLQRERQHGLEIACLPVWLRWTIYCATIVGILLFGDFGSNAFIYFQF